MCIDLSDMPLDESIPLAAVLHAYRAIGASKELHEMTTDERLQLVRAYLVSISNCTHDHPRPPGTNITKPKG
jgi:hypothetical protein